MKTVDDLYFLTVLDIYYIQTDDEKINKKNMFRICSLNQIVVVKYHFDILTLYFP